VVDSWRVHGFVPPAQSVCVKMDPIGAEHKRKRSNLQVRRRSTRPQLRAPIRTASANPSLRRTNTRTTDTRSRLRQSRGARVDFLIAPRRHHVDPVLLAASIEAGAQFESGLTVTGVATDTSGRAVGVTPRYCDGRRREIPASFVVGADGVRSRVARAVCPPGQPLDSLPLAEPVLTTQAQGDGAATASTETRGDWLRRAWRTA